MSIEIAVLVPHYFIWLTKEQKESAVKMCKEFDTHSPNMSDFLNPNNYIQKDNKTYCIVTFIKR